MFVRVKRSVADGRSYEYLQIVRSCREGKRVRQQVVASLGRKEDLLGSVALILPPFRRFLRPPLFERTVSFEVSFAGS